ncbi:Acg family FMN-binding oxidoreductase [Mycobacterium florentinum]|nr:NAD(P)H nitroreductase [Mycobacterium florentinum]
MDVLKGAVTLACRAPSYHNSQPWHWVADRAGLHLFLDPARVVQTDPTERQALISSGAALDHLRVAMRATGWKANICRCPDPDNLEHLASITFTEMTAVTEEQRRRAAAIATRRTDRLAFGPVAGWNDFEAGLRSRIDSTVALVDVIDDADRQELAYATDLTDSLRLYDSPYFETLQRWTAPFEASEGIPYDSLPSAAEADRVDVARSFPVSHHPERRAQTPADLSTILVISSHADSRRDLLGCGETLSTILLEATVAGLATCTLTHLTELATSRHLIAKLTGRPRPEVLVRIGRTPDDEHRPPPTPRRPLADVLTVNL